MPQLEEGYTRIANEILEKIAKTKLNGTQFRILMIVWRSTYGWNKKEHKLSLSYLSKATEINKQQLKREVDAMIKNEILIITEESTYTTAREISFNKNYILKKSTVSENADSKLNSLHTVSELAYSTVSEKEYSTVSELAYQKRHIKNNIKRNNKKDNDDVADSVYEFYKEKIKASKSKQASINNILTWLKEYTVEELKNSIENYKLSKNKEEDKKYLKECSNFFGVKSESNGFFKDYLLENYSKPREKTIEEILGYE